MLKHGILRIVLAQICIIMASSVVADPLIMCPSQKEAGCHKIIDPLGRPAEEVLCPKSHCKVRFQVVDGQKICKFSCPDYIIDPE